jgi:hypothetical protein
MEARRLCPAWNGIILDVRIRKFDFECSGAEAESRAKERDGMKVMIGMLLLVE